MTDGSCSQGRSRASGATVVVMLRYFYCRRSQGALSQRGAWREPKRNFLPALPSMDFFELRIEFTPLDLDLIHQANESVIVVKKAAAATAIVWATFRPLSLNYLRWANDYGTYASSTAYLQHGPVRVLAYGEAVSQQQHLLGKNGYFLVPSVAPNALVPGSYLLGNHWPHAAELVLGLTQTLELNGCRLAHQPISALAVPAGQAALADPADELLLFLAADLAPGMAVDLAGRSAKALPYAAAAAKAVRYAGRQFILTTA